jgi:hypothetical protein
MPGGLQTGSLTIYCRPGLRGLELWHGLAGGTAGGTALYRMRDARTDYFAGLREFLLRLHRGDASTENPRDTRALRRARGFARAIFCGGEAADPLLDRVLRAAPLPFAFTIDDSGCYSARGGAWRIFAEMGWRRGIALDLGQSRLKVITQTQSWTIERDLARLPREPRALNRARGRTCLRDMIAAALALEPAADGIVLGLPAAITRGGIAGPSTYPGLAGPVETLLDGLSDAPWVVLNDAVLTALGFPPAAAEKTLVLTLGFGIGGALWHAR